MDHFDLTLEGWDLWRSSWVNALVAVATIPTSEPSGPEKFGRSFGVFFLVSEGARTWKLGMVTYGMFFFWGGEEEGSWVFRQCLCFLLIFVEVNWRSVGCRCYYTLTFQWFFGRLLDERDFQLHLDIRVRFGRKQEAEKVSERENLLKPWDFWKS